MPDTGEIGVQAEITDKFLKASRVLPMMRVMRKNMRTQIQNQLESEGVTKKLTEVWGKERHVTELFSNCIVSGPHWSYTLTVDRNA